MGGRDQSERLVAINWNRWSQSAGARTLGLDPAMLEKEVPSTPNARAETIVSTPIFPAAFMRGRCLICASGYYE
jgi:putative SOS response-associated peptidase YedK